MGEVQRIPEAAVPVTSGDSAMVSMLERVLMNPDVPVERLERIIALHREDRRDRARVAFSAAMADMQSSLPVVDEKGGIRNNAGKVQSTYAKWADINEAIVPVLKEHGFSLTFKIGTADKITVTGILSHRDGHSEDTSITLPHDSSGSKNAVQAVASSVSYGKRYTAGALLNLTSRAKEDADDDGKAAGGKPTLDAAQLTQLRDALAFRDIPEDRACRRFKVEALEDIYQVDFDACLRIAQAVGGTK